MTPGLVHASDEKIEELRRALPTLDTDDSRPPQGGPGSRTNFDRGSAEVGKILWGDEQ
jgi:hypothetical protein